MHGTYIYPVLFVLLPDRKKHYYLLTLLKNVLFLVTRKKITGDFEAAVVSAINQVFPDSVIAGYDFNFSQCLKNNGLTVENKENEHPTRIQNMRCFGIITFQ
jgi:hypothetical protein